jgi:hypothetical protein
VVGDAGGAWNSAAGTGADGAGLGAGLGPGRGPGAGAEPLLGAAGAAGVAGPPGLGAWAAGRAGAPGVGAGFEGATLRGADGLAADLPALPPPGPWKASVSLRTTGASIVEDAERTNSPSSWSLAMTTLLSTPISLASSYTRTLATSLLLGPGWSSAGPSLLHGRTHRVLIECSSQSRPTSISRGTSPHGADRAVLLLTGLPARRTGASPRCPASPGLGRPGRTPDGGPPGQDRQGRGADKHPDRAAYRDGRERMHPRPPPHAADRSWPPAAGSRCRFAPGMLGSTSDQTPLSLPPRADVTPSSAAPYGCSSAICPADGRNQPCGCSVSGRMSIRHPVSRAASRAFWPSLPIASESW